MLAMLSKPSIGKTPLFWACPTAICTWWHPCSFLAPETWDKCSRNIYWGPLSSFPVATETFSKLTLRLKLKLQAQSEGQRLLRQVLYHA